MSSSTISQTSCISAVHSRLHLRNPSHLQILPSKVLMMNNINGHAIKASTLESKSALNRTLKSHNAILGKPNSSTTEYVNGEEISEPPENVISEQQRSAKIHDFCFGLPYGGIVLSGGLIGFIFSRNTASLMTGGLYGGALLALSVLSLKIWKRGQSSTPFILGQLGIAAALLWKNIQTYSLTKKILPTGFHIVLSTAMLCFYTYVIVSGGNPPPKKLKSSAASES
ncbi:putative TMEM14 family protein [Helianthus anomalus]